MIYLRTEEINELATKLVHEYRQYIGADWGIFKVEPLKLAEMLGLEVKFVDLGYESKILGFTSFNDVTITFTDSNQSDIILELTGRTVVINVTFPLICPRHPSG